jgi:hypothetical protein
LVLGEHAHQEGVVQIARQGGFATLSRRQTEASHTCHPIIYQDLHKAVCAKQDSPLRGHCITSGQIPVPILRQSCNVLEALSNLLYLAELEADDPQKVREYLSLSKERLRAMNQVLVRGE